MGNDGGTIGKRKDLVSLYNTSTIQKDEFPSLGDSSKRQVLYTVCSLLGISLFKIPIVSDYKGHLFAKETILEKLLNQKSDKYNHDNLDKHIRHIVLIKNVRDIQISWTKDTKTILCPISGESKNVAFSYSRACGCVLSHKAFTSIESAPHSCPQCTMPYNKDIDLVIINPTNIPHITATNEKSFRSLEELNLYHNKTPKKRMRQEKSKISSIENVSKDPSIERANLKTKGSPKSSKLDSPPCKKSRKL